MPIIFHDLRRYGSHLIMQEMGQFNQKKNVILIGIEKYMAFMLEKT